MIETNAATWPGRRESLVRALEELWRQGQQPDPFAFLATHGPLTAAAAAAILACDQWQRWHAGQRVLAEEYLQRYPDLAGDVDAALELVYGEFLVRQALGEQPAPAEYLERFPALAAALGDQFALGLALDSGDVDGTIIGGGLTVPLPAPGCWPAVPGYEVLGELGQGGMGVVYRVRHLRLNRLAALKMIRAGAPADERDLLRFLGEAEAVARLQHPNIVQIYDSGQHQGLPYFTMELVAGGSLLQRLQGTPLPATEAARLVEQLAQGIHHAHQKGIIHRDLKPANILLATMEDRGSRIEDRGSRIEGRSSILDPPSSILHPPSCVPKIADFGLARRGAAGNGLTTNGAVLGTPSYMAPEQAAGEGERVGPAADVYALGAILYECLTGRPPFRGATPLETLHQVLTNDPVPPARLNPRVPRDLDTICRKCLYKEPGQRYASAQELAADLQRFVRGESIRARPMRLWERTWRWCRRRPAWAGLWAALVLLVAGSLGAAVYYLADQAERAVAQSRQEARREGLEQDLNAALEEVVTWRAEVQAKLADPVRSAELLSDVDGWHNHLVLARAAWDRADRLANGNSDLLDADLAARVQELGKLLTADEQDWRLARELDAVRLAASTLVDGKFDPARAGPAYTEAFGRLDVDFAHDEPAQVAARLRPHRLRYILVAALDHWSCVGAERKPVLARLLATTRLLDPHPWRDRVRRLDNISDQQGLEQLARTVDDRAAFAARLDLSFYRLIDKESKVALLSKVLRHYPRDFWLHIELGVHVPEPGERIGCFRTALALRPRNTVAHVNLGTALHGKGDLDGAIDHFRQAIVLNPEFGEAHNNLGIALLDKKCLDEALAEQHKAIALDPGNSGFRNNLGLVLYARKDLDGALVQFQKALGLDPRNAMACSNLGNVLRERNELDRAIAYYHKAIAFDPNYALAHGNLGNALRDQRDLEGALASLNKAIELDPRNSAAHANLGGVLYDKKDLIGAVVQYQRALDLNPKNALACTNLGVVLRDRKELDKAIALHHKAIALDPDLASAYVNLGGALFDKKDWDGAIVQYHKAIERDPNFAGAYYNLGRAWHTKKNLALAVVWYKKAIDLNPRDAAVYYNLGITLREQNDLNGAIDYYQQAIHHDPRHARAHNNLGNALRDRCDMDGALDHLRTAIAIDPQFAAAHNNLGLVLRSKHDLDGALVHFQRAIDLDPNYTAAYVNLGVALTDKKDLAGAVVQFRKAIAIDPQMLQAHLGLGVALLQQGHFAESRSVNEKVLQRLPSQHPLRPMAMAQMASCDKFLALEKKLAAVPPGANVVADVAEQLALADLCLHYKQRYAAATRFLEGALAANPQLVEQGLRSHAARGAILAGAGLGQDAAQLTEPERAKLRQKALDWLKADLDRYARAIRGGGGGQNAGPLREAAVVLTALNDLPRWQRDEEWVLVRDANQLARLPAKEAASWQSFWREVDDVCQQARECFAVTVHKGSLTAQRTEEVHDVAVRGGQVYVVDLESSQFDSYLRVEDAEQKVLGENNDVSPDNRNARLLLLAPRDGTYRFVATSVAQRGQGQYLLTIREFRPVQK